MLRHYIRQAARVGMQFVFSRRQFKLFLQTSMRDLDLRLQALASVTDFFGGIVRPIVIRAPFGQSMLVVAPHQDDEAIGCGGALALQRKDGGAAAVIVLQDGADEHVKVSMTREELRELRNDESRASARVAGIADPVFLGLSDLAGKSQEATAAVHEIIEREMIDVVFTPFVLDGHPDHRACSGIVANALASVGRDIRVLQYEVWGHCIPNVAVIVDDVIEKKREMLRCFAIANSANDYVNSTLGLNMFNSRLLPAGEARFVERYFELPRKEFVELMAAVNAAALRLERKGSELSVTN
jgi:N-acetylglucosamine malate deacetylase 1